jgi:hypothetical protein
VGAEADSHCHGRQQAEKNITICAIFDTFYGLLEPARVATSAAEGQSSAAGADKSNLIWALF